MKIYIAGPMRGIPLFNFPAFAEATARLRAAGHEVISPAEMDIAEDGMDPAAHDVNVPPKPFAYYMARDLLAVCRSDAVAVLPGWQQSEGARLEVFVAHALGLRVFLAEEFEPVYE